MGDLTRMRGGGENPLCPELRPLDTSSDPEWIPGRSYVATQNDGRRGWWQDDRAARLRLAAAWSEEPADLRSAHLRKTAKLADSRHAEGNGQSTGRPWRKAEHGRRPDDDTESAYAEFIV